MLLMPYVRRQAPIVVSEGAVQVSKPLPVAHLRLCRSSRTARPALRSADGPARQDDDSRMPRTADCSAPGSAPYEPLIDTPAAGRSRVKAWSALGRTTWVARRSARIGARPRRAEAEAGDPPSGSIRIVSAPPIRRAG